MDFNFVLEWIISILKYLLRLELRVTVKLQALALTT